MADTKSLPVDLLRTDANTQNRKISEDAVEDYAELIEASKAWPLGTLTVFHDGNDYYVADGFHRTLAAKRAKRSSVPCIVHKGTAEDARIFGMTANDAHGIRMSRAEKKACVEWLLDNRPKMTQAEVAEKAGVDVRTVRRTVSDRKPSVLDKPVGNSSRTLSGSSGVVTPADVEIKDHTSAGGKPISDKGKPGGATIADNSPPASSGPASGKAADSNGKDFGKCPNCGGSKWAVDEFGPACAKCHHPHGEPVGDPDEQRVKDKRARTIKTCEALMREFDDLNRMVPRQEHVEAIASCKFLLKTARAWK